MIVVSDEFNKPFAIVAHLLKYRYNESSEHDSDAGLWEKNLIFVRERRQHIHHTSASEVKLQIDRYIFLRRIVIHHQRV